MAFDYRGIGASLDASSVRASKARKQDWGTHDMPAALDYLVDRFPDMIVHLVGHSAGGQLVGLMPNHRHLSSVVTVSSSSGYIGNMGLTQRLFATIFLKIYFHCLQLYWDTFPLVGLAGVKICQKTSRFNGRTGVQSPDTSRMRSAKTSPNISTTRSMCQYCG